MVDRKLIVWSGGMDSTANVINAFSRGQVFDTCYIKLANNRSMQKRELKARKKILKHLTKLYGKYHASDYVVEPFCDDVKNVNHFDLALPLVWLNGILHAVDISQYNEISFGYLHKDGFWHVAHRIEKVYKNSCKMMSKLEHPPKLSYPLQWLSKNEVYESFYTFDDDVHKVIDLIWTCETPNEKGAQCGKCNKCKELENMRSDFNVTRADDV
jgi:7-cyano-7-deazaguanine synthase in queuosine biosynthesis